MVNSITNSWMKVFHHKVEAGYFTSIAETLRNNVDGRFSILYSITDSLKIDGWFEFMLEYPFDGLVYHWQQKENPIQIEKGTLNSDKYRQMLNPSSNGSWVGYLSKSSVTGCTLLDGTLSGWWFSIGTIRCDSEYFLEYGSTIPGPSFTGVKEVVLWIRVPQLFMNCFPNYSLLSLIIVMFHPCKYIL